LPTNSEDHAQKQGWARGGHSIILVVISSVCACVAVIAPKMDTNQAMVLNDNDAGKGIGP